jgi:uncharacterized protein YndB with AHSA1/START domain
MLRAGLVALVLSAAWPAVAQVSDASSVAPDGRRTLAQTVVVDAGPGEVWRAFATADGFTAWAVPKARIDLRLGGLIESTYDPDAELGSDSTIANEILAYAPERMLAFRNVRAPAGVPFDAAVFQSVHTVVLIDPAPNGRTRVSVIQPGHGSDAAADAVYDFFAAGNRFTLEQLKAHLEKR